MCPLLITIGHWCSSPLDIRRKKCRGKPKAIPDVVSRKAGECNVPDLLFTQPLNLGKLNLCTNFGTRECRFAMYRNFICFLLVSATFSPTPDDALVHHYLNQIKPTKKLRKPGRHWGCLGASLHQARFGKKQKRMRKKTFINFKISNSILRNCVFIVVVYLP